MINTIQLQPHTTSTIPLHIESPATLPARTAIEIIAPQSIITDSITVTLTRNDETGQILIPTTTLSNLIHKKFTILETLEPHSLREYVLTFQPIASLQPELQRQNTPLEIKYGIEVIESPASQYPSPKPTPSAVPSPSPITELKTLQAKIFTASAQETPTSSPTPTQTLNPQVLGVTTTNSSSQSAIHFNVLPKLPPIFFLLLFTGVAVSIYAMIRNSKVATREKRANTTTTERKENHPQ